MRNIIVSDTSPLNYLVQIDAVELLPRLFSQVIIPPAVAEELLHPTVPESVRLWVEKTPVWLERQAPKVIDHNYKLDAGEAEAVALAVEIKNCSLLVDERKARKIAGEQKIHHIGTLGLLVEASRRSWINFDDYVHRLCQTNFRIDDDLVAAARQTARPKLP